MYKPIIDHIKINYKVILLKILNQLKLTYLSDQKKVLSIGFDCL